MRPDSWAWSVTSRAARRCQGRLRAHGEWLWHAGWVPGGVVVAVGRVPVESAGGVAGDFPAEFVDEAVVGPAQQGAVVEVGGAAVFPPVEVVGLAVAWWAATAGEAAATVAVGHGASLRAVEDPLTVAEVDDGAVLVDEDAADDAVTTHPPHGLDRQGDAAVGLAEPGFEPGQGLVRHDHV